MAQYRECDVAVRVQPGVPPVDVMNLADVVGGKVTQASRVTPDDYVITVAEGAEDEAVGILREYTSVVASAERIRLVDPTAS